MILRGLLVVIITLGLLGPRASIVLAAQFTIRSNDLYAGWSVRPSSDAVRSVVGQWTVPEVQCDAFVATPPWFKTRAAVWLGVWGQTDDSSRTWLAQIGTVSLCKLGQPYSYTAVAELHHISNSGGYIDPGPYTLADVKVQPGDIVTAMVTYYGRQSDKKLKYEAYLASSRGRQQVLMLTDPGVSFANGQWGQPIPEADAAWQAGCIVESQPDTNLPASGGLAKFTTPITFTPFCSINGRGLETYSGLNSVFRWDMRPDGKVLADTGSPGRDGAFSVIWRDWR